MKETGRSHVPTNHRKGTKNWYKNEYVVPGDPEGHESIVIHFRDDRSYDRHRSQRGNQGIQSPEFAGKPVAHQGVKQRDRRNNKENRPQKPQRCMNVSRNSSAEQVPKVPDGETLQFRACEPHVKVRQQVVKLPASLLINAGEILGVDGENAAVQQQYSAKYN